MSEKNLHVDETRFAEVKICHDESLADGGPENYKKWYRDFDEYTVNCMGCQGPQSVCAVWKKYHSYEALRTSGKKHKIFDAGCGTGQVSQELLLNVANDSESCGAELIEIYGGDYSPDMISIAREKNTYADLQVVNLKEELPYKAESFDSIVCSGVFIPGHCGAECIPNILRVLKKGCYFIMTIRVPMYQSIKSEIMEQIVKSDGILVEEVIMPYFEQDAQNGECMVLVIQRKQ